MKSFKDFVLEDDDRFIYFIFAAASVFTFLFSTSLSIGFFSTKVFAGMIILPKILSLILIGYFIRSTIKKLIQSNQTNEASQLSKHIFKYLMFSTTSVIAYFIYVFFDCLINFNKKINNYFVNKVNNMIPKEKEEKNKETYRD
jgi:nitrogen fixation/metabolism regulation signal transduction histidine kinase